MLHLMFRGFNHSFFNVFLKPQLKPDSTLPTLYITWTVLPSTIRNGQSNGSKGHHSFLTGLLSSGPFWLTLVAVVAGVRSACPLLNIPMLERDTKYPSAGECDLTTSSITSLSSSLFSTQIQTGPDLHLLPEPQSGKAEEIKTRSPYSCHRHC